MYLLFCRVPFSIICNHISLEAALRHHFNIEPLYVATMISDNSYTENSVQKAFKGAVHRY